ncbi:MAG TPA: diguanylate cyclase [Thiobacillus sp.]
MQRGFFFTTGAAFIALVALVFGLVLALLQFNLQHQQLHAVLDRHNLKIDLITQTQAASRLRTESLFRIALTDDPFERDAYFLEFNHAGFLVGSGRNALRQMGFTPDEKRSFDAQTRLVNDIQAVQERVFDLLNAERSAEANQVLVQEAIPLMEAFNRQLADMRTLYQQANLAAQQQALRIYRSTFALTVTFGIAAIALASLIAWHTWRRIRLTSQKMREQMSELEHSRAALHEEATHDSLTGLANRRLFYDRLQQAIRHAHRYGGKLGIMYVDLDRFKDINDLHGHHVGDAVLTEVAKRLTTSIRDSDTVARLGGDEFVVLLEGVQGHEDYVATAHKIEQALTVDSSFFGLDVKISASIGHALYPEDGTDEDALIRAADAAMYRIKTGYDSERQARLQFQ